jgi:hypothetical protein
MQLPWMHSVVVVTLPQAQAQVGHLTALALSLRTAVWMQPQLLDLVRFIRIGVGYLYWSTDRPSQ